MYKSPYFRMYTGTPLNDGDSQTFLSPIFSEGSMPSVYRMKHRGRTKKSFALALFALITQLR